jgi:hypothetical protein
MSQNKFEMKKNIFQEKHTAKFDRFQIFSKVNKMVFVVVELMNI